MRGVTVCSLAAAAERVRWKLLQAYRALAQEGAITEEQLREVAWLLEHIDEVPAEELRARLMAMGAGQARGRDDGGKTNAA